MSFPGNGSEMVYRQQIVHDGVNPFNSKVKGVVSSLKVCIKTCASGADWIAG